MRREVVEVVCGRCKRKEYIPTIAGVDLAAPGAGSFTATLVMQGEKVLEISFDELCPPCSTTIRNHLEAIKRIQKASPSTRVRHMKKVSSSSILLADSGAKKKAQG